MNDSQTRTARCILATVIATLGVMLIAKQATAQERRWTIGQGAFPDSNGNTYYQLEGDRRGIIRQRAHPNSDGNIEWEVREYDSRMPTLSPYDGSIVHDPATDYRY